MTNVFAMNVFFDVPVKLYSFHYLMFAILLTIPDMPRLYGLFVANVSVAARDIKPFWHSSETWVVVLGTLKVLIIGVILWTNTQFSSRGFRWISEVPCNR